MRFDLVAVEQAGGEVAVANIANRALDDLNAALVVRIDRSDFKSGKAWALALLHQVLCHRVVDLVEATIFLWANKRWLMSVIAARSALETVALVHYIVSEIEKAVQGNDDDRFRDFVLQQLFSMKRTDYRSAIPPTQILTAIDRLAKKLEGARRYYDGLSEYAHPNSTGTFFFFAELDAESKVANLSRDNHDLALVASKLVLPVCASTRHACDCLGDITKMLDQIAHDPEV